ncbi:hypothetical protein GGF50DRAFT_118060 [Schizophyllum commune]
MTPGRAPQWCATRRSYASSFLNSGAEDFEVHATDSAHAYDAGKPRHPLPHHNDDSQACQCIPGSSNDVLEGQPNAFTPDATQERQCPPRSPNAADTGNSMILGASPSYHHVRLQHLSTFSLQPRERPMPRKSINDRASLLSVAETGQLNDSSDIVPLTA